MSAPKPNQAGRSIPYSQVKTDQTVIEAARARIAALYDRYDLVIVSFSGGKDSTCCLHLALEEARRRGKPCSVAYCDEEIMDPDTEAYIEHISRWPDVQFYRFCVPIHHSLRSERGGWTCWDEDARDIWFRPLPADAITWPQVLERTPGLTLLKGDNNIHRIIQAYFPAADYGPGCHITGIRAEEALNRRRAILSAGTYIVENARHHTAKPIYDWTRFDVWYFIREGGFPYSGLYDKMQRIGRPLHSQRLAPWGNVAAADETAQWMSFYPDAWIRALRRIPELDAQARHGGTKLFRRGIDKPPGFTWQDWTLHLVNQMTGDDRARAVDLIRQTLRTWERNYSVPFPEEYLDIQGQDQRGGCWKALAQAIDKNDPMQRNHLF